jgi:polysaccharide biosynthesis/export protein
MNYYGQYALFLRTFIVGILAALISGCVLAPGMHLDSNNAEIEPINGNSKVTPVIKEITPQLIENERQLAKSEVQANLSDIMLPPRPYTIGPGDHLAITVWDHPELVMPATTMTGFAALSGVGASPPGYTVSDEGKIQFPYAGDFKIAGLTELEARNVLVERLSHYIRNPEVTLRVMNFRSKRVYVDGEVRQPGIVQVDDIPLSLPEVLNRAGGITSVGDQSRIRITRAGKTFWIDLPKLTKNEVDPSRIILNSGDMLSVRPRDESKVFVIGEVLKPTSLPLRDGRLSLNEALGEAGGINPLSGDGNLIYVIRDANDSQPIVYHLEARSPAMLVLADNFELKANDVVYVDSAPLVRYNRILSLILPTIHEITYVKRNF